jgi:hypothetical protein
MQDVQRGEREATVQICSSKKVRNLSECRMAKESMKGWDGDQFMMVCIVERTSPVD